MDERYIAVGLFVFPLVIVIALALAEEVKLRKEIRAYSKALATLIVPSIARALREFSQRVTNYGTHQCSNGTLVKSAKQRENCNG